MEELFDPAHVFNFVALLSYILVKELFLDKQKLSKELEDVKTKKDPLNALKIDLTTLQTKVVNLEELIGDKLDLLLNDSKEMRKTQQELSERILVIETRLRIKDQRRR